MAFGKYDRDAENTRGLTEAFHFLLSNELPVLPADRRAGSGECVSSYDLQRLLSSPREGRGPEVELLHLLSGTSRSRQGMDRKRIESSPEAILILDADRIVLCTSVGARRLLTFNRDINGKIFNYYFQPGRPLLIHLERPDRSVGVGRLLAVNSRWEEKPAYLVTVLDVTGRERTRVVSHAFPVFE